MKITFKKLIVENRFNESFKDWNTNNELEFTEKGFINVYAPNGVGKSSIAKALKGELNGNCEFELEIDGQTYNESNRDIPILVIDDFFGRNIAKREDEQLSDYILGSQINREIELDNEIKEKIKSIGENLNGYLKNEFKISKKDSNTSKIIEIPKVKNYIKEVSNSRNKGKDYDIEKIIELLDLISLKEIEIEDSNKYTYVKNNIEESNSIIQQVLNFDLHDFSKIDKVKKLDYSTDAVKILEKHKDLKKCIFDESHELPEDLKIKLEENKNAIMESLSEKQKAIVSCILDLQENAFGIKEAFITAFETGNASIIEELIDEINKYVLIVKDVIGNKVYNEINSSRIKEKYEELKVLRDNKVKLTEEDELLLESIIKSCLNKDVILDRDDNKNIIFKIGNEEIIGKTRQELPLSTGEQNFISLYFELLAAKNSNKDIIIIDDPISSFDSIYKNKIIYAIIKVLEEKNTIILTHNINTIKLMHHQYKGSTNMYLLNNSTNDENGFIKVDSSIELDLVLEINKVIDLFKNDDFITNIKDKEQFLVSIIPFLRSYTNIIPLEKKHYKRLCKLMHGYINEKINVNEEYLECFGKNIKPEGYFISTSDILSMTFTDEIIDKEKYPLLNRTLYHIANYLQLRLLVENTLYNLDTSKIDISKNIQLNNIILTYLDDDTTHKTELMSKKTLLNEFNHFEYDMCLFLPALDISNQKLNEEKDRIKEICDIIKSEH